MNMMNKRIKKTAALLCLTLICGCGAKKDITVEEYTPSLPTDTEQSSIFVQKIDDLSSDFIMGMDISSLLTEEASGVKYYDDEGNEQDLLKILADSGINCVRVRVWNDPFDSEGHGYGGGNCTAETAAEIGKRAAAYGISLCVDFHYSDFWADPKKQMVPKAWSSYDTEQKAAALGDYTKESLKLILDSGADVTMVQIGNEINNGMSGEKGLNNKLKLIKAGCAAVREVASETGKDIKIVLHYTQIDDNKNITEIARQLQTVKVDYDVFGVSYYPYWHGSMENLTEVLRTLSAEYGVKTCVMETAYPYTTEDGDGTGNSVDGTSLKNRYPVTVQGQANAIRDIIAAAFSGGAMGVFYWEGAWIPVGSDHAANQAIWENFGSGWASSYATEYDPDDAGKYYGGSSWDNQAMFDFSGKKLASLDVFKYARYGATGPDLEITTDLSDADLLNVEVSIGGDIKMPDTLDVVYNDTSVTSPLKLTWNTEQINAIDTSVAGTYSVEGTAVSDALPDQKTDLTATVKVANINYIVNPGFEDNSDGAPWTAVSENKAPTDIQDKEADAHDGTKAFHYYNAKDFWFDMQQEITDIPAGQYKLTSYIQGGDMGSDAVIYMYAIVDDDMIYQSDDITVDGWQQWKEATIVDIKIGEGSKVLVGYRIESAGGGWGTIDDFDLSLYN